MRKTFFLYFLAITVLLPWACSDNNSPSKPTSPVLGGGSTPTFTGTIPTATNSPTPTPTGVAPFTPTPTWTWIATPQFYHNYGTSAAPNGIYYDSIGGQILVAEAEISGGSVVNGLESFPVFSGGASLGSPTLSNVILTGNATPAATPALTPNGTPWAAGASIIVHFPIGMATSNNSWEVLDSQTPSSAASLYVQNFTNYPFPGPLYPPPPYSYWLGWVGPFMNFTSGYSGASFNNPKCLTADSIGNFYVADTGNGCVEKFDGGGAAYGNSPGWMYRWTGPGAGYPSSPNFIKPNTLACDSNNYVYVGDSGPYGATNTSMVQVYGSGGTTLLAAVTLIQNCQVNGLTVDPTGQTFYVSDSYNGQVEEYQFIPFPFSPGLPSTQVGLVRAWGDPHSYHEYKSFKPACLQIIGSYIIVSDQGNDFLNVFGP